MPELGTPSSPGVPEVDIDLDLDPEPEVTRKRAVSDVKAAADKAVADAGATQEWSSAPRAGAPPPRPKPSSPGRISRPGAPPKPPGARPGRADETTIRRPAGAAVQDVLEPPPPDESVVDACVRELGNAHDEVRAARLHFEIARSSQDAGQALEHYQAALAKLPTHQPSIRAARRLLLALGRVKDALRLFDAEIGLTGDTREQATLQHAKGRALEDLSGEVADARECYRKAVELDATNPSLIRALEQAERRLEAWEPLTEAGQHAANAVAGDARMRAALLVERARLLESRLRRGKEATELYEQALRLDPEVAGALPALERLLYEQNRWSELVDVLERVGQTVTDPALQVQALFRIGRLQSERLGNRELAVRALARAMGIAPTDRLVLDALERLYEVSGEANNLATVLAYEVETVTERRARLGLLHRIGMIHEKQLDDDEQAQRWYEAALGIEPTYLPALHALDGLYERAKKWQPLIVAHLAAAEGTRDSARRADHHARIAEVFERHVDNVSEAMRHHGLAFSLSPKRTASFKALVRLYTQNGRHRELIELYGRAVDKAKQPDVIIAYQFKCGALYEDALHDPAEAVHCYRKVLELEPEHLGAIHALQRAAESAKRHEDLVEALELEAQLTKERERELALRHRAGDVLVAHGDKEAGLARFRKVLSLRSNYSPALKSIGALYFDMGRYRELLEVYQTELGLLESNEAQVALLFKMGELCEKHLADDDQAIALYRKAIGQEASHGPSLRALQGCLVEKADHKGLVGALQSEIVGSDDPAARARTAYRMGEVYEIHLKQLDRAVSAYRQALAEVAEYRPAIDGLLRVNNQLKSWGKLAGGLLEESSRVRDQRRAIDCLLRAGEIFAVHLTKADQAVMAYESVRELDRANLAALLALEALYREAELWAKLADVYAVQAEVAADPRVRVAALEELARLFEHHEIGDQEQLRRVYAQILQIDGAHVGALTGLERLAIATSNHALLADVDARFARASHEPHVIGAHLTRLGLSLEVTSAQAALDAYKQALDNDPDSLTAIRGLARAAEANSDVAGMVDAARREARWTNNGAHAAALLVKSAQLCAGRLGDAAAALSDSERAIERHPANPEAAAMVSKLLRDQNEIDRLIKILTRAAGHALIPERVAALWREVAVLYADAKRDVPAGIAALDRMFGIQDADVESLLLLGDLYARDKRWKEAAEALERVVDFDLDPARELAIHLKLARIFIKRLDDRDSALHHLGAVLDIDELNRDALTLMMEAHLAAGDAGSAAGAAAQLVKTARDLEERASALQSLARVELQAGRQDRAAKALFDTVAILGPQSGAAAEYKKLLGEVEPWDRYVEAMQDFIRRAQHGELPQADIRPAYLAVAQVQHEVLKQPDRAIDTLRDGLSATGGDPTLHVDLADRLLANGRSDVAIVEYRRVVAADPTLGSAWRGMSRSFDDLGRKSEANLALGPLVVLAQANDAESSLAHQKRVRTGWAHPGSFDGDALKVISAGDDWEEVPIAAMLQGMLEALPKVYPTDWDGTYAISARDKVTNHPLREQCDRLAQAFRVTEFELYVHRAAVTDVVVELTSPPSLMVPHFVIDLPETQRVFMLSRAFAALARGVHPAITLGRREVSKLLCAALRLVAPTFGHERYGEDELNQLNKRLYKAMSRRARKALEPVAQHYLTNQGIDVERWGQSLELTTTRAAALLANDIGESVEVMRRVNTQLQRLQGPALVRSAAAVADLMRFWTTDSAIEMRRNAGII
jgi:tetratricopeptide (TPR) repeat protein